MALYYVFSLQSMSKVVTYYQGIPLLTSLAISVSWGVSEGGTCAGPGRARRRGCLRRRRKVTSAALVVGSAAEEHLEVAARPWRG